MRRWMACLLIAGIGCVLQGVGAQNAGAASLAGKRAIFDETFQYWTTPDAADRTLRRIKEAGFNVYIPVVWYGAGTTWPSRHVQWDRNLASQAAAGMDPLRYVIEKAHSMNIEVHPWFTVALQQADLLPEFALRGQSEGGRLAIFDLHNPRFRAFITDVIAEVVSNYDVDGVNLDYIRMMGLCTNDACTREYRERYGRNLALDAAVFRVTPHLVPTLIDYQESTVTGLVREISERVRSLKPTIVISADVHPELTDYLQGQNGVDWANRGYVDVLFRMDYAPAINIASTDAVRKRLNSPDSMTVLIGNYDLIPGGAQPRSGRWIVEALTDIAARWPRSGAAVYLYNQLSDDQVVSLFRWDARRAETVHPSPPGLHGSSTGRTGR
jgi:uncharacterized lipoprotein YddW (UPF0748 family)